MDWSLFTQFASIAIAGLALIVAVVSSRSKAVRDAIEANARAIASRASKDETEDLFARMRRAEERIAEMSNEIEHLPDKDTAHRMEMAIARLEGRLETMDERLKPVAAMASRMQEAMIERVSK